MPKITFVLDNVRSAFNVGSVFRTADGLNADVHLIGISPIPQQDKKLEKTSLSSLDFVEWKYFEDCNKWLIDVEDSKSKSLIISVEETEKFESISLFDIKNLNLKEFSNIYLVFGHEINGVSESILEKSDKVLKIPMFGKKNSLNIATCVGIVGYRVKELIS